MRIAAAAAACLALNAAFAADTGSFVSALRPSVDVVMVVALAAAASGLSRRGARAVSWILAGALIAGLVYRTAGAAVPRFFGRPLAVKHDIWLLPNLYDLLFDSFSFTLAAATLAGVSAALAVGLFGVRCLLQLAARPLAGGFRPAAFLAAGLVAVVLIAGPPSQLAAMTGGIAEAFDAYDARDAIDRELHAARVAALDYPTSLERLAGADVYVFFVESYGRTLWRHAEYRERFEPFLREYDLKLEDAGYRTASHFARSPVKGGGSWLAHASFHAGVDCDNPLCYERILESRVRPLASYFRHRGYRTLSVLPAVDIEPEAWPEGDYFEFDETFWHADIGYRGPRLGWSPVPDQFAVQSLHARRLASAPESPPLFVEVSLTTSHPPFHRVPPYLASPASLDALNRFYGTAEWHRFDNGYAAFREAAAGYTAAIRYSLRSVLDYVIEQLERPALVIVLGDHQPVSAVQGPGGRQVPVHVISRDAALIEAFEAYGFRSGLVAHGGSRLRLSGLLEVILSACSDASESS